MSQPTLGKNIAELRTAKGLTQQELANKCSLNVRTIQRIEAGEVMPRMYTLNMLAAPLGANLNQLNQNSMETKTLSRQMQAAYVAGLVFIINSVPVIYHLITHQLPPFAHVVTSVIHMVSSVFFLRGFYLIGKFYKNWLLAVSIVIMTVLFPVLNLLDLFKNTYFSIGQGIIFILMSINMVIIGAGMLKESLARKGQQNGGSYQVAGILIAMVGVLYLSLNVQIINTALLLSVPVNVLMLYILYRELNGWAKLQVG
ncbi:helix-turn-helix transcriptional regulator [Mucilaginibacter mali]|uniref:Helix-turn-helix transcriptional regulator n=1 Tax=Mucilaginibacter mali TaxID=2740462 RepID=A0A7D4QAK2_9SPHI|nr:helix-turn-helix transcriptional regulator [Mucilaginibacter mali]QKJ32031.1 helix-turn-helix transcriptional regulator [Mucilaginibacter mali]